MILLKHMIRINMDVLSQVVRMYDVGGKLLNGIKRNDVNILVYVRVKGVESE